MDPTPEQSQLFTEGCPVATTGFVNARVSFQTEDNQRVILVHGVVFSHYSLEDRCAEAYALVSLFESGYADQNDLARCFGYSTRTLRRYQERLKTGGLSALARPQGRPSGQSVEPSSAARDRTILRLKAKGMSNRWIGGRLGLSETAVRKALHRLGWESPSDPTLPLLRPTADPHHPAVVANPIPHSVAPSPSCKQEQKLSYEIAQSLDSNPLDRSMDRLLAALGALDDARPLFAPARNLPRAGVLLAVPALVASGLLPAAEKIYGTLRHLSTGYAPRW